MHRVCLLGFCLFLTGCTTIQQFTVGSYKLTAAGFIELKKTNGWDITDFLFRSEDYSELNYEEDAE